MTTEEQRALASLIADEVMLRTGAVQDAVTTARRALADADDALLALLALLGVPARPLPPTRLRPRRSPTRR